MLGESSQTQKATGWITLVIWSVQNRQIYREKNRLVVAGAEGLSVKWAGGVVNVKEYPISFVHGENVL